MVRFHRSVVMIGLLLAACIAQGQPSAAWPQIPTTSAGKLLAIWLDSFNSGNPAEIGKFQSEHLRAEAGTDPARRVQHTMGLRGETGGFTLQEIESSREDKIVGLVREKNSDRIARVTLEVDSADKNRIANFSVLLVPVPQPAPAGPPPERVPVSELIKDVDAQLAKLTAEDTFSGAVLIGRDGKVVWEKAYGLADRETSTPNTVQTVFRIGSMNKMFTSVAIAQLVEKGKLKFTDTIARVLPDYPNKEVAAKVTVGELLTHTSGLGDYFTPEFDQKKDSLHQLKDYLPLFVNQTLQFAPGQGWGYSNAGFLVLGLMVEKLSGESYYDYVQKHVYDSAGMTSAGNAPADQKVPNLAIGYTRRGDGEADGPPQPNTATLPWRGGPAGGGYCSVEDLLRFDQALRQHKLLSAEMTNTITAGKVHPTGLPDTVMYAYGFSDKHKDGDRIVGHNGGAPGMNAQLDMHFDTGYTVVVLANRDPHSAEEWARYISLRLPVETSKK